MNAPLRYTLDVTTTRGMVHVGDCLAWLRSLPDESVDAVVTDPPYGLGKEPDPREVLTAWLAGDEYKPGGSGFMGRAWDAFVPSPCVWQECLRVLKPGGHLLAFAGTRTYDWIVLGVRLAGFEVRDMLSWVYSTGFPKSLNLSRAVDADSYCSCGGNALSCDHEKAQHEMRPMRRHDVPSTLDAQEERGEVLQPSMQERRAPTHRSPGRVGVDARREQSGVEGRGVHRAGEGVSNGSDAGASPGEVERVCVGAHSGRGDDARTASESRRGGTSHQPRQGGQQAGEPEGLRIASRALGSGAPEGCHCCEACGGLMPEYSGWGTALKPAVEPIVMARKPLRGTVASNVLEHGTGGLNVDGCRVDGEPWAPHRATGLASVKYFTSGEAPVVDKAPHDAGRWPANLLHDGSDEVVGLFPQTGPASGRVRNNAAYRGASKGADKAHMTAGHEDNGGSAARFFYCAKATRREREAGLDHLPRGIVDPTRAEESAGRDNPRAGAGRKGGGRANVHPTVKPLALMRWLVRLVTPPGGLVIDPYTGSGTTGVAAVCEGMRFAGAELDTWHGVLAHERIAYAMGHGPSGFEDVAEGDEDDDNGADVVPMQAALPLGG